MVRFIKTDASMWIFDFETMQFRRDPLMQDFKHPYVRYESDWQDFIDFSESESRRHSGYMQFVVQVSDEPDDNIISHYRPEDQ